MTLSYLSMQSATRQASSTNRKQQEEEKGKLCHQEEDGDDDRTTQEDTLCHTALKEQMPRAEEMLKKIQVLYSGLGASLFGTTVSQGVYFYFYSVLRGMAVKRRKHGASGLELQVGESLAIASFAGMANVLLTNPIWMVATRMQTYRSLDAKHKSIGSPNALSVIKSIFSEYGLGGFWNGVGASLIMVINPTIQYALYEWLMSVRARISIRAKKRTIDTARPSTLQVFLMSALAKAGATVLTYPMLTVKTRMMSARKEDADIQYASVQDAVRQIFHKEGVAGYYRGMSTKITQSILGAAILLVCKEKRTDIRTTL
jgi:adenine nucleotide transporter 17